MIIKVDVKRKYLHFERHQDGSVYVYASDKTHNGKKVTLEEMDNECSMNVGDGFHLIVPLADFLTVKE